MPEEKPKIEEQDEPLKVPEPEKTVVKTIEHTKSSNIDDDLPIFEMVSLVPGGEPSSLQRIKIYKSGATMRMYVWVEGDNAWHYCVLT